MPLRRPLVFVALLVLSACSLRDAACGSPGPASQGAAGPTGFTGESTDPAAEPGFAIAFLGDSLTAGFRLLSQQAFPARIEEMFAAEGYTGIDVINAGLSNDTSAGGLRRVERVLEPSVRILVVSLGGNDALRGLAVAETRENLQRIIDIAEARGVLVMLCGMKAPTNLGEDYRVPFEQLYFDLLRDNQRRIVYVAFLLEGVAGRPEFNQADGIHPNEAGSQVIAGALFPLLRGMVDGLGGGGD